jgi:hypothetical protein
VIEREIAEIASDWATWLGITDEFWITVTETTSGKRGEVISPWHDHCPVIIISPRCEMARLEDLIVHELMHVRFVHYENEFGATQEGQMEFQASTASSLALSLRQLRPNPISNRRAAEYEEKIRSLGGLKVGDHLTV